MSARIDFTALRASQTSPAQPCPVRSTAQPLLSSTSPHRYSCLSSIFLRRPEQSNIEWISDQPWTFIILLLSLSLSSSLVSTFPRATSMHGIPEATAGLPLVSIFQPFARQDYIIHPIEHSRCTILNCYLAMSASDASQQA